MSKAKTGTTDEAFQQAAQQKAARFCQRIPEPKPQGVGHEEADQGFRFCLTVNARENGIG